jgi:hypothetical protein
LNHYEPNNHERLGEGKLHLREVSEWQSPILGLRKAKFGAIEESTCHEKDCAQSRFQNQTGKIMRTLELRGSFKTKQSPHRDTKTKLLP